MKKIIALGLISMMAFTVNATSTTNCSNLGKNNQLSCMVKPAEANVFDSIETDTVLFGASWIGPKKDMIALDVRIKHTGSIVREIAFNIDNDITVFQFANTKLIKHKSDSTDPYGFDSIGTIYIPTEYLKKLLSNKSSRFLIATESSGSRVGGFDFYDNTQTPAKLALKDFLKTI